jgi:hypothetical protein
MKIIYIRQHSAYKLYNAVKLGKTTNIINRDSTYATGEIIRGIFYPVYEILSPNIDIVEKQLHQEFKALQIRKNAGTEFFNEKIIDLIDGFFIRENINARKIPQEEIDKFTNIAKYGEFIDHFQSKQGEFHIKQIKKAFARMKNYTQDNITQDNITQDNIWMPRNYQIKAIDDGFRYMDAARKFYLNLPTGGGKSYIVYNIMHKLLTCKTDIDLIIIQSPRQIVNSQNVLDKYTKILNPHCNIYNYSDDSDIDTFLLNIDKNAINIIVICTKSMPTIYKSIQKYNTLIWFDEAHHGIENWTNLLSDENKYNYLKDNTNIKYRIFSSASPDSNLVEENVDIFGKLYSPTTVKQLIADHWLCPILPYVYKNNIKNVDTLEFTLNEFTNNNKKFGFSFHNAQDHAFQLFYKHYIKYKENKTTIKPFLLIGHNDNKKLQEKIKKIKLDYDFLDINTFENKNGKEKKYSDRIGNHLGYVVAKYSMGYDFRLLDFIAFNDPKLSIKDIIQCIGRGIRPDCLGEYGSNLYKELILLIPIFYNSMDPGDYDNIIQVIRYLISDNVGLEFSDIKQITGASSIRNIKEFDDIYTGDENNESILLDLIKYIEKLDNRVITYENAKSILLNKNIKSKEEYKKFCASYNLKHFENGKLHMNPYELYPDFNWVDYLSIAHEYYTLEECKMQIKKLMKKNIRLKKYLLKLNELTKQLCEINSQFPPYEFWEDYYKLFEKNSNLKLSNIIDIEFLFCD